MAAITSLPVGIPGMRFALKTHPYRCSGQSTQIKNSAFSSIQSGTKRRTSHVAAASVLPKQASENMWEPETERNVFSDVVVWRRRNAYWGRKWNVQDIGRAAVMLLVHFLCLLAPFHFTWVAFGVGLGLYVVTGLLGITLCFHRNLTHRSFKLPKWLEYFFAYCGVQALQGDPIDWVSTHRFHHQFCDTERDPHSPLEGFWHSHFSWFFDSDTLVQRCGEPNNVGDLEEQPFYKFMQRTYPLHPVALAILLYAIGGMPFIIWGMGVRCFFSYHITFLVNSVCHLWGKQAWNTGDLSKNNWWMALLTYGEGWHNNHHAFEFSARHGLEWWQIDTTWYAIRLLQAVGLATDVKLPTDSQKQKMAFGSPISQT